MFNDTKQKKKQRNQSKSVRSGPLLSLHGLTQSFREALFIVACAASIFIFFALFTYHRLDPSWSHIASTRPPANLEGFAGAWVADVLLHICGYVAYLLPLLLLYSMGRFLRSKKLYAPSVHTLVRAVALCLIVLTACGLASLHFGNIKPLPASVGGILGMIVGVGLAKFFNNFGATLLLSAILLSSIVLFTGFSWLSMMEGLGKIISNKFSLIMTKFSALCAEGREKIKAWRSKTNEDKDKSNTAHFLSDKNSAKKRRSSLFGMALNNLAALPAAEKAKQAETAEQSPRIKDPRTHNHPLKSKPAAVADDDLLIGQQAHLSLAKNTCIPSLKALDLPDKATKKGYTTAQLEAISREVVLRLKDFNVDVKVVAVHPGPVVTRFELELAAGTKASKITGLARDLARSLSVISVRVVEVIPGKSVVGLELPNAHREIVRLREVLATEQYQSARSPLTLALGKDIAGHAVVVDLAKMPHLLVAGTTGSGKSVGLNAMLLSLLYKSTPEQLRIILIDPKMLELSVYEGIPHLLTPVVTDMKEAANALRWCVAEMERRYRLMASLGVRNITGYNQKIRKAKREGAPLLDPLWQGMPAGLDEEGGEEGEASTPPPLTELPCIMVLVDEFADMMMVVGKKVEELIARIAQKARAAGIHLILATQRPSVDVITGLIKANVPTRIAFQVSSKIDSRTILDQQGAEQLLGHGDMLYAAPGTGVPVRVHGAFVADEEVERVVKMLKKEGDPQYVDEILDGEGGSQAGGDSGEANNEAGEADALYDQAVELVTKTRRASISSIQRRFKIGYNRAARIVESMEAAGVVSTMSSNGVREVLAPPPRED